MGGPEGSGMSNGLPAEPGKEGSKVHGGLGATKGNSRSPCHILPQYDCLQLLFLATEATVTKSWAGVQGKHGSVKGGGTTKGDTTLTFPWNNTTTWGHRSKQPK